MTRGQYERTPLTEAKRRLSYSETVYARLLETHRKEEADYRLKLSYLEDHVETLQKEEK